MRRLPIAIVSLAVLVSLGVSWGVNAVRGAATGGTHDPLAPLDLTPGQRERLAALSRAFHPFLVERQRALDAERERLAGLLAREPEGSPQIEASLREIARLAAELDREVVRNLQSLKPHLTPEQQVLLFRYVELHQQSVERGR